MASEKTILDLVGRIYDASADPHLWPEFLGDFAKAFKSKTTTLFVHDLRSQTGSSNFDFGIDPDYMRAYADYFAPKNVYLIRGRNLLRPGNVTVSEELCPDEEVHKSEFYNDWVFPQGQGSGLLGVLFQEHRITSMIGAIRPSNGRAYGDEEVKLVRALVPHLQRALQLQKRFRELESLRATTSDALDRWHMGVIVLDAAGNVVLANRTANEILAAHDGLTMEHHRLHASLAAESAALQALIHGAMHTTNGNGLHAGGALTLSRPSCKRSLNVLVCPVSRRISFVELEPAALVFVSDPEKTEETDADVIQRLYGLTHAEANVTLHLVEGKNVQESAEALAVEPNTVRIHLKKVFEKTGARRQAEVVRMIMQSPALVRKQKK